MSSYQHRDGLETTPAEVLEEFKDPHLKSREVTGHPGAHRDAANMRRHFGIPPFDPDAFEWGLVDDVLVHEVDADAGRTAGGTDVFAVGAPGSGKSSLANYWAVRLSEINDEKVVWRASPSRSEWLPLAPWATLWLPEGDVEARLRPTDPRESAVRVGVEDLDAIVRDIERYATPRDLNDSMDSGINIVYPDPAMAGCQTVVEQSARQVEPPDGREELFSTDDPTKHWWFAWVLDRVDSGPHDWTTWICDEIGDICPHGARKDSYATYQKVELLKDTWVDARKHHLSIFGFGHSEADVHGMVRRKMRWRVAMPTSSNPTSASGIVGFQTVPMRTDMTSEWGPGRALMFTESSFQQFRWKPMPTGTDWKLHVRVSPHISVSQ